MTKKKNTCMIQELKRFYITIDKISNLDESNQEEISEVFKELYIEGESLSRYSRLNKVKATIVSDKNLSIKRINIVSLNFSYIIYFDEDEDELGDIVNTYNATEIIMMLKEELEYGVSNITLKFWQKALSYIFSAFWHMIDNMPKVIDVNMVTLKMLKRRTEMIKETKGLIDFTDLYKSSKIIKEGCKNFVEDYKKSLVGYFIIFLSIVVLIYTYQLSSNLSDAINFLLNAVVLLSGAYTIVRYLLMFYKKYIYTLINEEVDKQEELLNLKKES